MAAYLRASDGSVTFLASSIPDLGLDCLVLDLQGTCGEFNTDG